MLKVLDAFELKEQGTILYCKDNDFHNMSWNEINDYIGKINRIKICDKNLREREVGIKKHDIMMSISDKIAVALLIDKTADIMIPSDVTIVK